MRIRLALLAVACLAGFPAAAATTATQAESGIAVLPLRARGLTVSEYRRVSQKITASFRAERPDAIAPDEIASRLARDEKQKAALEDARRLSAEGLEKARELEHQGALERYGKALALYREHFGEYADPQGLGETFIRRGAERLTAGDTVGARSDFFSAVTYAPDLQPSLDDYPPPVVSAWEAARADRIRKPLPPEDAGELASLGSKLGLASICTVRADKGDRPEDGIAVEMSVWPVAPPSSAPLRVSKTVVAETLDPIAGAVREIGAPIRVASATNDVRAVRIEPARTDTIRDTRADAVLPRRRPVQPRGRPAWKSPWVWGGAALLVLGAGAAAAASSSPKSKTKDGGYDVSVIPGS